MKPAVRRAKAKFQEAQHLYRVALALWRDRLGSSQEEVDSTRFWRADAQCGLVLARRDLL